MPLLHSANEVVQRFGMCGPIPLLPHYGYGLEGDNLIIEISVLLGCYSTLRNIPEERRSHAHRGGHLEIILSYLEANISYFVCSLNKICLWTELHNECHCVLLAVVQCALIGRWNFQPIS